MMYPGKDKETITEIRSRMYSKQKKKSSCNIIPDHSSAMEHVKRAELQTYIWKQIKEQNIEIPPLQGKGWKVEDGLITPVWFQGEQLPPSLTRKTNGKDVEDGYSADSEEQVTFSIFHSVSITFRTVNWYQIWCHTLKNFKMKPKPYR